MVFYKYLETRGSFAEQVAKRSQDKAGRPDKKVDHDKSRDEKRWAECEEIYRQADRCAERRIDPELRLDSHYEPQHAAAASISTRTAAVMVHLTLAVQAENIVCKAQTGTDGRQENSTTCRLMEISMAVSEEAMPEAFAPVLIVFILQNVYVAFDDRSPRSMLSFDTVQAPDIGHTSR